MRSISCLLLLFFCTFLLISCNTSRGERRIGKILRKDSTTVEIPKIDIHYRIDSIADTTALRLYREKYTPEQQEIIGALNRIDPWRIKVGKKVVLPDTLLPDLMMYSPFPEQPDMFSGIPKLIIVHKRIQAVALYENGKLIRWGPCSTGRKSKPTPSALYYTNFKKKLKISTVDGEWKMPYYFNIANFDGIGLHQFELPGYPASHSCIRLFKKDAMFIFNWADQWEVSEDGSTVTKKGTPVIVFGEYDFAGTSAWKAVVDNKDVLQLTKDELKLLEDHAGKIKSVSL